MDATERLAASVRAHAHPFAGTEEVPDALLQKARRARFVLLGEATHGTAEFYRHRAAITRRLIEEYGFEAVAVEADWPDAYRVNRYVRGLGNDPSAREALGSFTRFPLWMWRNPEVLAFAEWLRAHNEVRAAGERVGFYGLDLYSLYSSADEVIRYLERVDPEAAAAAKARYGCLDHTTHEPQAYGARAAFGIRADCEEAVVRQLVALQEQSARYLSRDGVAAQDEQFQAEQNARVVKSAERYYRAMYRGGANTWNLRDRHMADTLERLSLHLQRQGRHGRIVVWEHNSHVGDARATEVGYRDINVGQLIRERFGIQALLVGYTTFEGSVSAASEWGGEVECKPLRPGLKNSYEALFHASGTPPFLLPLWDTETARLLDDSRLERAVGVIYLPETERYSHYFEAELPRQFDAVIHFDRSRALEPLDRVPGWQPDRTPQTFPFGA